MDNNIITAGNFVVLLGCENCECENRGFIYKTTGIVPCAGHRYTSFCGRAKDELCLENLAACGRTFWFPLSWLNTYPHLEAWHGK